jgi:hypothetical protein
MAIAAEKDITSKADIIQGLRDSLGGLANWIELQPQARFTQGPEGRWTMGQHLDHLIRSVQPLTQGLRAPKLVLGLLFGTAKRPSHSYARVVADYEQALDDGGKASGKFVPPAVPLEKRNALLHKHRAETETLIKLVNKCSEADLDKYGATHPLIGWLTLRELLFFTIHHHDHHLETLKRDYAV